jgi:hypothetical protein
MPDISQVDHFFNDNIFLSRTPLELVVENQNVE